MAQNFSTGGPTGFGSAFGGAFQQSYQPAFDKAFAQTTKVLTERRHGEEAKAAMEVAEQSTKEVEGRLKVAQQTLDDAKFEAMSGPVALGSQQNLDAAVVKARNNVLRTRELLFTTATNALQSAAAANPSNPALQSQVSSAMTNVMNAQMMMAKMMASADAQTENRLRREERGEERSFQRERFGAQDAARTEALEYSRGRDVLEDERYQQGQYDRQWDDAGDMARQDVDILEDSYVVDKLGNPDASAAEIREWKIKEVERLTLRNVKLDKMPDAEIEARTGARPGGRQQAAQQLPKPGTDEAKALLEQAGEGAERAVLEIDMHLANSEDLTKDDVIALHETREQVIADAAAEEEGAGMSPEVRRIAEQSMSPVGVAVSRAQAMEGPRTGEGEADFNFTGIRDIGSAIGGAVSSVGAAITGGRGAEIRKWSSDNLSKEVSTVIKAVQKGGNGRYGKLGR